MSSAGTSREENVFTAKLAEQAEQYEEMVEFMENVAKAGDVEELTVEERNLLSVAYKNVIGARRASWRIISSIEHKEESRGNEDHVATIKEYRGKIEAELSKICDGILGLLESHLIPSASSAESKVFYLKMKGDYHRWLTKKPKKAQSSASSQVSEGSEELGDDSFTNISSRTTRVQASTITHELRLFAGTWNVAGRSPVYSLAADLDEWLNLKNAVDIYVLGFQEIVPLNTRTVIGAEDQTKATKWNLLIGKTLNRKEDSVWLTPTLNPITSDDYQYVKCSNFGQKADNLARELILKRNWKDLRKFDQLRREEGGVFQGWKEGNIDFAPTYKYVLSNSNRYSGGISSKAGEKQRTPAWCDRILWHGKGIQQLSYICGVSNFSDHRPVSAVFILEVEVQSTNPRAVALSKFLQSMNLSRDIVQKKGSQEPKSTLCKSIRTEEEESTACKQ
ncbi:hypothetical protein Ancab_000618 [Ancistrocladus abbreviatus]